MKRDTRQLPLDLPLTPRFGREDFLVSPSNEAAWAMFESWPDWPGRIMLLIGPSGAGKSHLGAIWAAASGARVLGAGALSLASLPGLSGAGAILLEDVGEGQIPEKEFFHLINLVHEVSAYLAITSRSPPEQWRIGIPDLRSRLRLAPIVEIDAPDDALVRAVLVKLFIDRQLIVDTSVVEFLAMRIERSLGAARRIVEMIDREALARGRPVTRPMASEVLARIGEPGEPGESEASGRGD